MVPRSKLPQVGTTIFTVMSRRASELGAINLGQGYPDYDIDPRLPALVHQAMIEGFNQYAPMPGYGPLCQAIAGKLRRSYGLRFDPEREITVTLGATEALYSAIQALVFQGDQAIVFDPSYDSYDPAVQLAGATCIHIPLVPPAFRYDWDRVRDALSKRTRLLVINSPQNPACTCLRAEDLDALCDIVRNRDIHIVSDEVYEHMVFDGRSHQSVLSRPELRERSVVVFSFGKTLHATGLRVGYAVAPAPLTAELRKVHQYNTFTIAMPLQVAIAGYLHERPDIGRDLSAFFAAKRDRLLGALAGSGLTGQPAEGSYFQLVDYAQLSNAPDIDFADQLLTQARVATIPLSAFYRQPPAMTLLRLCVAKRDETLDLAAGQILEFAHSQRGRRAH